MWRLLPVAVECQSIHRMAPADPIHLLPMCCTVAGGGHAAHRECTTQVGAHGCKAPLTEAVLSPSRARLKKLVRVL